MKSFAFERGDAGETGKNVDSHGSVATSTARRIQSEELSAKMRFSEVDNSSVNR